MELYSIYLLVSAEASIFLAALHSGIPMTLATSGFKLPSSVATNLCPS